LSPATPDDSPRPPTLAERVKAYLFERLGLDSAMALAAKKHVPVHRATVHYFLGGMALFLFGIQVATGILLSLYYKPSPEQAFESVRTIMTEVDYGWLIRSIHTWSANLLIGVLYLHLLTTFMMRAYRRPREFTWITGVLLLGVFLAFGFSGYLLPWNQLAFFATRVGTKIVGSVPFFGNDLLLLARGGENVTGDTLARFYALHVVILPLAALGLLAVHLFLVQKHGMSIPDSVAEEHGGAEKVPSMPFVPHFLLRDMVGWYFALGLLAFLAAIFPWELGLKADPFGAAPEGIKPEWYFLFMFQTLKVLPPHILGMEGEMLGVLFFGVCGLAVLLVPLLDRDRRWRSGLCILAGLAVAFFIVATAQGYFQNVLYRFLLGAGLSLGMLALSIPFLPRLRRAGPSMALLAAAVASLWVLGGGVARASEDAPPSVEQDNQCILCHGDPDLWEGDTRRFFVTAKHFADDIHWREGLRCQSCHGGDATTTDFAEAHAQEKGFRAIKSPADVPAFCGDCHADNQYMRHYQPAPVTDQLSKYWTSGHGQRLKATGDAKVATCISCHGTPHSSGGTFHAHGILAVHNLESPVYPTNLAQTCAACHANPAVMAGREYHGRLIGHDQYAEWRKSVHGVALMDKGDLTAPTCNDCHGNHGALPPDVDSVANACGTCHTKVADLFTKTRMSHKFENVGLPGCATCHGSHAIHSPSDQMLGMTQQAVCSRCHAKGVFGATLEGANAARAMRAGLDGLKLEITQAEADVARAEVLGMEVSGPRYDLRQAHDALTDARSLIHSFSVERVSTALKDGQTVAVEVDNRAKAAIQEYQFRRVWLASSLVPIAIVIGLLLLYIRSLPAADSSAKEGS